MRLAAAAVLERWGGLRRGACIVPAASRAGSTVDASLGPWQSGTGAGTERVKPGERIRIKPCTGFTLCFSN